MPPEGGEKLSLKSVEEKGAMMGDGLRTWVVTAAVLSAGLTSAATLEAVARFRIVPATVGWTTIWTVAPPRPGKVPKAQLTEPGDALQEPRELERATTFTL